MKNVTQENHDGKGNSVKGFREERYGKRKRAG